MPALIIKEETMIDDIVKYYEQEIGEMPYCFNWKDALINIIIMAMYTVGVICVTIAIWGVR